MNDKTFLFTRYGLDRQTGELHLHYAFEDGPDFEEIIRFPPPYRPLTSADEQALDHALRLLFLLAGVSYYKAYAPTYLRCDAFPLDAATATLAETIYRQGLGEFAYKNNLDLSDRIRFQTVNASAPQPIPLNLPQRRLVPIGGGKDSIVSLECLKSASQDIALFAVGNAIGLAAPIQATIAQSGLPAIAIARTLSPSLIALNKTGVLNGHVPITAIISAIAVVAAILYGYDAVILSNEHSASAPNLRVGDIDVNHQYSKSLAFERDFAAYVTNHITPALAYFSLLRPLTEASIAKRFAKLDRYHPIFRSCNTAFRQDTARRGTHWCCDCPKCRFVFLALAPFMDKPKLTAIFGTDMLNDPMQTEGFAELCGLAAIKPFECVGEIEESSLLLQKLAQLTQWQGDAVIQSLAPQLPASVDFEARYADLFAARPDHLVPAPYLRLLHACD